MSKVIFANVNPNSRYKNQRQPHPFPVVFEFDSEGYHWRGGIGGRYQFSDLDIFIERDGEKVAANTFAAGEQVQIMESFLADMKTQADNGDLYPEWIEKTADSWITQLKAIASSAYENYPEGEE
jgi:hypothetical protein